MELKPLRDDENKNDREQKIKWKKTSVLHVQHVYLEFLFILCRRLPANDVKFEVV